METVFHKIIVALLVLILTATFGFIPAFISRRFPILTKKDAGFNKKACHNIMFSALLNFGGGALFANCFCHWLPEIREGKSHN